MQFVFVSAYVSDSNFLPDVVFRFLKEQPYFRACPSLEREGHYTVKNPARNYFDKTDY